MWRMTLLVVLVASCDRGKPAPSQGSAPTAPQANLMRTVANGVFDTPADAASPPPDAAGPPTLSGRQGLSTLGRIEWYKQDDATTTAFIEQHIGLAGVTVTLVDGNWSVKRGDQELVRVVRREGGAPEGPQPALVIVFSPEIPTDEGIKVGDKVAAVIAKHPNLECRQDLEYDERAPSDRFPSDLACAVPGPPLFYYLRRTKKLPKTRSPTDTEAHRDLKPAALADIDIIAIAHNFD